MKEFKESFILILVVTLILLISFIIGKGVDFNPEAREACLINPYLMSFYEDQSGNQNHLTLPENINYEYISFDGFDDYLEVGDSDTIIGYYTEDTVFVNSTDIIVGKDYLFMGDTITAYPNYGYSASSTSYMIFSVNVFTVYEVNKIFKELEKRWEEKESIIIKPDSLENQLFKINE